MTNNYLQPKTIICSAITCKYNSQNSNWIANKRYGLIDGNKKGDVCLCPSIEITLSPNCHKCDTELDFMYCSSYLCL